MMLRRFILLLLILSCTFQSPAYSDAKTPKIGVWITVFSNQEVLSKEENADKLIETCKTSGIDHIYLQVYRADKSYYSQKGSVNYLLNKAKENNIKIYAWINCLSISNNKDASILKKYGESVLNIDQ